MKLAAMMVVRNELGRYLTLTVPALLEFCDIVVALDDHSDDGTCDWMCDHDGVILEMARQRMFENEGAVRQQLLQFTLQQKPSHILAVDADEFVPDGDRIRDAVSGDGMAWSLQMGEIWKADRYGLQVRTDGGWRPHPSPVVFRPDLSNRLFRIADKQLACGREPLSVRHLAVRGQAPVVGEILHFGWACEPDRQERYERYVVADGGRFHASRHLQSIMFDDSRVQLEQRPWPDSLGPWKEQIVRRVNA